MPEVVGPDLQLEAVGRSPFREHHDAGVVDEDVDGAGPCARERANRLQLSEVEMSDLGPATGTPRDLLALGNVAHGKNHPGSRTRKVPRGCGAQAARGAGDDHGPAGHVGEVVRSPLLRCHRIHCAPTVQGVRFGPRGQPRVVCALADRQAQEPRFRLGILEGTARCASNPTRASRRSASEKRRSRSGLHDLQGMAAAGASLPLLLLAAIPRS